MGGKAQLREKRGKQSINEAEERKGGKEGMKKGNGEWYEKDASLCPAPSLQEQKEEKQEGRRW